MAVRRDDQTGLRVSSSPVDGHQRTPSSPASSLPSTIPVQASLSSLPVRPLGPAQRPAPRSPTSRPPAHPLHVLAELVEQHDAPVDALGPAGDSTVGRAAVGHAQVEFYAGRRQGPARSSGGCDGRRRSRWGRHRQGGGVWERRVAPRRRWPGRQLAGRAHDLCASPLSSAAAIAACVLTLDTDAVRRRQVDTMLAQLEDKFNESSTEVLCVAGSLRSSCRPRVRRAAC